MADTKGNLFKRLTRLFRSGPLVKRNVLKRVDTKTSSAFEQFRKNQSQVYSAAMSAYGSYDRMARYSDFSEMEYCLHGDTKIAVPDGFKTIKELSEEYGNDKSFIVYSYDHKKKQIVPALGKQARKTRTDMAYKVTFDSGKVIIGTGNHRLMLRDGTYKTIDQLNVGDSMMPFYRKNLFNKKDKEGYQWIYNMNYESSKLNNGWNAEHKIISEWAANRKVLNSEHVHHKNFKKYDNRPENLLIMDAKEHLAYHAIILNGKKWDKKVNGEWIEKFKKDHSRFMSENNPAERKDITFGKILNLCDNEGFNLYHICKRLDTDPNVIKRRLKLKGFSNFELFAKTYDKNWKNNGWDNKGSKNPRYDNSLTFQKICNIYKKEMKKNELLKALNTTSSKLSKRLKDNCFKNFRDFSANYNNHKVVSIEEYGIIDLYDLTVDGYKNFATDSVISHNTPEIASALDIYSEESVAADENGKTLHIFSENSKIREILTTLFYDTLNIEFNLSSWIRNLVKYGDFFLFNDVHPSFGVINAYPLPISEIEREEGFDPNDPMAVRFRWITQGNQVLENWQVSHMRLLGNDAFLPYGSSALEAARRIWRQLILLEDAMMVVRIVRAPSRRAFYIDVGNVPPEDIPNYMEQAQSSLKRSNIVDKTTGRVDLRYNPLSIDEDYFIPVRGGESGTKIEDIGGQTSAGETNDVEYIQKKLFAALKIPKAYLGYDEGLGAKATLSQEDIRFSRTIARIQRTVLSELNKLAIVHLYCHGFTDEDLIDFSLKLSNPSTIAQQQKLELFRTRFEVAGSALQNPGLIDRNWVQKNILRLSDEEIRAVKQGLLDDKIGDLELESTQIELPEGPESHPGGAMGIPGIDLGGPPRLPPMPPEDKISQPMEPLDLGSPPEAIAEKNILSVNNENAPIEVQKSINKYIALINEENNDDNLTEFEKWQKEEQKKTATKTKKAQHKADAGIEDLFSPYQRNRSRASVDGLKSEYDKLKSSYSLKIDEDFDIDEYLDSKVKQNAHMTGQIKSTLQRLESKFKTKKSVISENNSSGE
jgi:hypothetical protein